MILIAFLDGHLCKELGDRWKQVHLRKAVEFGVFAPGVEAVAVGKVFGSFGQHKRLPPSTCSIAWTQSRLALI